MKQSTSLLPMKTYKSNHMPKTMKALFCEAYGSYENIKVKTCETPSIGPNDILVQTIASSLTRADSMMRSGHPKFARLFLGLKKPKHPIMGTGFSGRVIAKGHAVSRFNLLDEVFGETATAFGANAEFIAIKESAIVLKKPNFVDHQSAALLCDGALTSYNFLHQLAQIQAGHTVLINGASGSLGTAAVQIAKAKGARVVGRSRAAHRSMVLDLGADDYRAYDLEMGFEDSIKERYDIIYDPSGTLRMKDVKLQLTPNGQLLSPVLSLGFLRDALCTGVFSRKKAKFEASGLKKEEDLKSMIRAVLGLIEEGQFVVPIKRVFDLYEAREAHRLMDEGKKHGNFVLSFEP
jgi:NADPH:quinone reductase-like Zn-dependent oxidoreductase